MNADETIIIACITGATLVTYINKVSNKNQATTIKPLVNMFVIGSLLLLVSMWNTSVAAMFAVLLLVTSLVLNGKVLFNTLSNLG